MKNKIDILFALVVIIVIAYNSHLLRLLYPYTILSDDTVSWYEHANFFHFWSHTLHETTRRLPFGMLLLLSKEFADPGNFIFIFHTCLFTASILGFYLLTDSLFTSVRLRIISTSVLLFLALTLKKIFYYNIVFMSEASTSFLVYMGVILVLHGYFKVRNLYLIIGYFLLGIGAFAKANTLILIPFWFLFLFYCYRKEFNLKVLIFAALLLVAPNLIYQIRTIYLGGLVGYKVPNYLFARTLFLLEEQDVITDDLVVNQRLIETFKSNQSTNEVFKISPYDSYMMIKDYHIKDYPTWSELVIQASGLKQGDDLFTRSSLILASRIIKQHPIAFIKLFFSTYFETFNTFNRCAYEIYEPSIKYSYINKYVPKQMVEIFFGQEQEFLVDDSKMPLIDNVRSNCSKLRLFDNFPFSILFTLVLHLCLVIFVFQLRKTDSQSIILEINTKNYLITYIALISTAIPFHLLNNMIHITDQRHTVYYELLINSSLSLLIIVVLCVINEISRRYDYTHIVE